ncbi:MAG: hypothetical protein KBD63_06195, partial [Bacteriovoracaceae bacterium]|nr:hypothetical protein [Bacteriovoracaceae bacterium]
MQNVLENLEFKTKFESIPFSQIKSQDFMPALQKTLERVQVQLDHIKKITEPSFETIMSPLDHSLAEVELLSALFWGLYHAQSTPELQKVAQSFSPMMTDFYTNVFLDEKLFIQIKKVFEKDQTALTPEQKKVLDKWYKDFSRNGILLPPSDQQSLREIDQKLAMLSLNFSNNLLSATADYILIVEQEERLKGIPSSLKFQAKEKAKLAGKSHEWHFGLDFPTYGP